MPSPTAGDVSLRAMATRPACRRFVRCATQGWAAVAAGALSLTGCANRVPVQMRAVTLPAPVHVSAEIAGRVTVDGDVLTLRLDSGWVQYLGRAAGDGTRLEDVTMRAVIASDSAGRAIPQGVSGALQVADALQVGERRTLPSETLAVPLPPGTRLRDLWLALQFRGTARPDGRDPELVIAYACSESNVLGSTKRAKARVRRMRAGESAACQL